MSREIASLLDPLQRFPTALISARKVPRMQTERCPAGEDTVYFDTVFTELANYRKANRSVDSNEQNAGPLWINHSQPL